MIFRHSYLYLKTPVATPSATEENKINVIHIEAEFFICNEL